MGNPGLSVKFGQSHGIKREKKKKTRRSMTDVLGLYFCLPHGTRLTFLVRRIHVGIGTDVVHFSRHSRNVFSSSVIERVQVEGVSTWEIICSISLSTAEAEYLAVDSCCT